MKHGEFHDYVLNNPVNFVLVMVFYALASVFFPYGNVAEIFDSTRGTADIFFIIFKIIFCVFPLIVYIFVTSKICVKHNYKRTLLILFAFLLVCLCNFPFLTLAENDGSTWLSNESKLWVLHTIKCFSVSLFEELVFRGVILALLFYIFRKHRYKVVLPVVISSVIFGVIHFANMFNGTDFLTALMQVGYSFLTGGMFAISYTLTRKIAVPVFLHFVFDFGGLLVDDLCLRGELWSVSQIVLLTVLTVAVGFAALYVLLKTNFLTTEIADEGSSTEG